MHLTISRETGEILEVLQPPTADDYDVYQRALAAQVRSEITKLIKAQAPVLRSTP